MAASRTGFHTFIAVALGVGALTFVALLAGFASGALTDDPPAVSPYSVGTTSTTAAPTTTAAAAATTGSTVVAESTTTQAPTTTAVASSDSDAAHITISGFSFGDPITATVGQEVIVTNSAGQHTWTSANGLFDSGSLRGGESFSFVFAEPGVYNFFCSIHGQMQGFITIEG